MFHHDMHDGWTYESFYSLLINNLLDIGYVGLESLQPELITTKVVRLNDAHVKVYSIQHYEIKVCQWLVAGH
jgi:hypothetical protein